MNNLKTMTMVSMFAFTPFITSSAKPQNLSEKIVQDTYEPYLRPGGITDSIFLSKAPSPDVIVQGKPHKAAIVINVANNTLYRYDKDGNPIIAYRVATGAVGSFTPIGVYSYENIEYYPYESAPKSTLRSRAPQLFGKAAIILNTVNPKTGMKKPTGIMIHGTDNEKRIGNYASGGCINMYEADILETVAAMKKLPKGTLILAVSEY